MTATHNVTALCQAIDRGDDTALPILADALEEQGDPRAAGLRLVAADGKRPSMSWRDHGGMWRECACWYQCAAGASCSLHPSLYRRLRGGLRFRDICRSYIARSAAYLALAAALLDR